MNAHDLLVLTPINWMDDFYDDIHPLMNWMYESNLLDGIEDGYEYNYPAVFR